MTLPKATIWMYINEILSLTASQRSTLLIYVRIAGYSYSWTISGAKNIVLDSSDKKSSNSLIMYIIHDIN